MSAVALTLSVWPEGADEPTRLEVRPRDVLQWEKNNRGRSAQQLDDDAWTLTYLYEIAWQTLGQSGEFDKWCDTNDVTWAPSKPGQKPDETPDPTSVAARTDS